MPMPPIPEDVQEALAAHVLRVGNNETLKQIADHFGLSRQYVGQFIRRKKLTRSPLTGPLPQETIQRIVQYLKNEGKREGLKKAGQRFGVSEAAVARIVERHGIQRADLTRISPNVKGAIVRDYQAGVTTLEQVATKHRVARNTASIIIKSLGGAVWDGKKYDIDVSVFGHNDPLVAYWIGFLFADGCLFQQKGSWGLNLTLSVKDLGHMETYCRDLKIPLECIHIRGSAVSATVYDPLLPKILHRWGIVQRKTYRFQEPSMGKRLLPHFLRGWIDGDGSIFTNPRNGSIQCTVVAHLRKSLEYYTSALKSLGFAGKILICRNYQGNYAATIYRKRDIWELTKLLRVSGNRHMDRKWSRVYARPATWYLDHPHPSEKQIEEMIRLYVEEELSCIAIAERLKRARSTVAKYLKVAGVEVKRENRLIVSKEKRDRIKELAKQGYKLSAICKSVDVCFDTAKKYAS